MIALNLKLVLAVVGLVLWQLPLPPKVCEAGKWTFIVALASWLWA